MCFGMQYPFNHPVNKVPTNQFSPVGVLFVQGSSNVSNNIQMRETSPSSEPTSLDSMSSITSTMIGSGGSERTRDLAICAVILDEWLKELSAITQEQSIVMLADNFFNHF